MIRPRWRYWIYRHLLYLARRTWAPPRWCRLGGRARFSVSHASGRPNRHKRTAPRSRPRARRTQLRPRSSGMAWEHSSFRGGTPPWTGAGAFAAAGTLAEPGSATATAEPMAARWSARSSRGRAAEALGLGQERARWKSEPWLDVVDCPTAWWVMEGKGWGEVGIYRREGWGVAVGRGERVCMGKVSLPIACLTEAVNCLHIVGWNVKCGDGQLQY